MTPIRFLLSAPCALALSLALTACAPGGANLGALGEPELSQTSEIAPPGAEPGTCWGKYISPAIIETVTHQVVVQPAQVMADGTVTTPAIYKTETLQQIVQERQETWFQTPCQDALTPEFIASLQRSLKVRRLYRGEITGKMTASTRAAVRRFQKPQGLDSGILSLAAARKLGLSAVERDPTG